MTMAPTGLSQSQLATDEAGSCCQVDTNMDNNTQLPLSSNMSTEESSDTASDRWATESGSAGSGTSPETPMEDPEPCDGGIIDKNYVNFPSVSSAVDRPVAKALDYGTLSWLVPNDPPREQGDEYPVDMLVSAAWALMTSRMVRSERVTFAVTSPGMGKVASRSLQVHCDFKYTVSQYLEAVSGQLEHTGAETPSLHCLERTNTLIHIGDSPVGRGSNNAFGNLEEVLETHALVLVLQDKGSELEAEVRFEPTVIEPWLVPVILKRLEFYMQQLNALDKTRRLADIETLSPHDMQQIWKWNQSVPQAVERCMHDMFDDQVQLQPQASAVDAWDGQLTYIELDELSERLAGRLISLGVGVDVVVPLCFEKSLWMSVAMMGVLKAGGAFTLLEPSFPEKRLEAIVNQVDASLILSSSSNMPLCTKLSKTAFRVDADSIAALPTSSYRSKNVQSSSTAMFVVFTSGSTGIPKGAILSHTNYASALTHQLQSLGFSKSSRVFDFASYAFDVSVHNVFATLISGACLCVPSDEDRRNDVSKIMADMRVTIAHLTPSVSSLIDPDMVPALETMVFTGEPLSKDHATRWWGKVNIVNEYGPAECTINTVNSNPKTPEDATSIGRTTGVVGWLVDPENHNSLTPIGCVGELLVEGPLVGCGYIRDEVNNAAAFIQDPEWLLLGGPDHPGRKGRLYRTGDLVQYREDGSLNFIGRKDVQVKIRGQRVDLGEVEHWTRLCTVGAEQVAAEVIHPRAKRSTPTLAVFIQPHGIAGSAVPNTDTVPMIKPIAADVQVKLAQHLPSYIVPTVSFWLHKLPMTPSGKLNRKALREIGSSFSSEQLANAQTGGRNSSKQEPVTEIEERIRGIWATVLDIPPDSIGLEDNFFHLGGDSIASMKAVASCRRLGIQVTVADVFQHPSLHELGEHCSYSFDDSLCAIAEFELLGPDFHRTTFTSDLSSRYNIDPSTILDAYPCTRLQEGLMFLTSKRTGDYIEQMVLELPFNVSVDSLRNAWEQATQAMPILRTRIVHDKKHGLVQLVLNDTCHWTESPALDVHLDTDRKRSMELGGPLSRLALITDGSGTYKYLVWTLHHAIYDGWSIRLVTDAVANAYMGQIIPQGPRFQNFIKHVKEQDEDASSGYWRNLLQGFDSPPFPAPLGSAIEQPVADFLFEHYIPKPMNGHSSITTSMLIRAAWALVMGRMSDSSDVVFGSTLHGRNAAVTGLNDLVAPTIATVPVRVKFDSSQTVPNFLQAIQSEAAEMMAFEQTGLQKIATLSDDTRRACQFQTHVVIQPEDSAENGGVIGQWRSDTQEQWFSTYALTLEVWLRPDRIRTSIMFDSRVIEPWVVKDVLRRLEWTVHQLDHADPSLTLKDINIATADDLTNIWQRNKKVPERADRCVQDLLADQVQARPNNIAICAWDGELTYQKLDELSTKLSRQLLRITTQQELVPLCFEKSMWTTVAILGVLKAGLGFILLDPHLPEQRMQAIVDQTSSQLIVTSSSNESRCAKLVERTISVNWHSFSDSVDKENANMPPVSSSSIAYAVFTSGSTGAPKGVLLTHANAVSAQLHQCHIMGHTPETRLFDFSSYSFDVSVSNTFSMLASGGCLCVPSEDDRQNRLEASIISLRVNTLDMTPSTIQLLSPERIPAVRCMTLGGEPLHASDFDKWCARVRICNAYGPSECTPTATINCNPLNAAEATHIGTGFGVVTWVVDPNDHEILLPPGCTGELLLEGPLVGPGYLGQPEKTQASFIEDPKWLEQGHDSQPGRSGRLYKTGDLVKYNEDGTLVFVGRKDTQVKVRGQRVEPSEIEIVLRTHPKVGDAVVVLQKHSGQDSSLAGFVTYNNTGDVIEDKSASEEDKHYEESAQTVQRWEDEFDGKTYQGIDHTSVENIGRDFIGWSSMIDGEDFDNSDMDEWLDDTISAILDGGTAGKVLEIGCGSGMMLFNLAKHGLESYVGVDPSARAVAFVNSAAGSLPGLLEKINVFKGAADDIMRLATPISPSRVIINSVLQYFPSQEYLLSLIDHLVRLGTVNTIFLGDVRSYALHKEFMARRALHIAGKSASKSDVRLILENLLNAEPELLIDPGFFTGLPNRIKGIRHVEILAKNMKATNELSSYRYAAVLHVESPNSPSCINMPRQINSDSWIDYTSNGLDYHAVLKLLESSDTVALSNIPYSKTAYEREVLNAISDTSEVETESDNGAWLENALQASKTTSSLCAQDLFSLAQQTNYRVEVSWARQHSQNGGLDAVFHYCQGGTSLGERRTLFHFPTDHDSRAYHLLSSAPLGHDRDDRLREELESFLRSRLPTYMVPDSITFLDIMPVNHNGKTDRRALSEMQKQRTAPQASKRPPSTALEKEMQRIWAHVLNIEPSKICMDDGFIQLGGNSLGAMKVVTLAREAGIELQVADMFRHQTTSISRVLAAVSSETFDEPNRAKTAISNRLLSDIARHDSSVATLQSDCAAQTANVGWERDPGKLLTVVLTGGNGFIGSQILRKLLEHGQVGRVIAIVRGESASKARQRTIDAAKGAQWWTDFHDSALEVWAGDLALPMLGLEEENWRMIEEGEVDIFIHNGASVHFVKSYAALEAANVESTVQILRAATKSPNMKVAYVSSARCCDPEKEAEEDVAKALADSPNGYNETKFVAEALVRRAAARCGMRKDQFTVVSPGLVVGTATEGVSSTDDWLWRMVATCIRIGAFNADEASSWVPIADAATTASTIIDAALDSASAVVTQVRGGLTMGEFWSTLTTIGYGLRGENPRAWQEAVRKDVAQSEGSHPLGALAGMLDALSDTAKAEWASSWHSGGLSSSVRLKVAIAKSAEYLCKIGFLPQPNGNSRLSNEGHGVFAFKRSS